MGLWTRVLATEFRLVYAFEPAFADILRLNLKDRFSNVVIYPVALGNMDGIVGFKKEVENSGNSHIAPTDHPTDIAEIHKLDGVDVGQREGPVDFIKIDVEGYEYNVILGAEGVIRSSKPVMVVEQKPGNAEKFGLRTKWAIERLQSWGAKVAWEMAGDFCLTWE